MRVDKEAGNIRLSLWPLLLATLKDAIQLKN
jgi:hypothetical protein